MKSILLLLLGTGSLSLGCGRDKSASVPITHLTIATGDTAGVYYPLGRTLAQVYTSRIPGVASAAQATVGSVFNVDAVQRGTADLAFTQGDVAYFAYTNGTAADPRAHGRLRAIAVLYVNVVQIVTRREGHIRRVTQFRGRRVAVGAQASGTEVAARILIEAHGLKYRDVKAEFLSFSEVAARIKRGTLDGGFIVSSYPISAISEAEGGASLHLVSLEPAVIARIRAQYPFFKPIVIPRGIYRAQETDIQTIGVENLLVCRADLGDALVRRLTALLFESHAVLWRVHPAAQGIDPDLGPTAPIPLHPGAASYYRELELLR